LEENQKQKAAATATLIVVNISIFFIFAILGKAEDVLFMREYGAMYEPYVMEGHEYYRLLTSIFLHFGIEHLLSNMVMLGALGMNLEPEIGKLHFLLVYFVSGIGGNICSLLLNISFGEVVISAGASGAVFGLTGALLCAVLRNKGRIGRLHKKGVLVLVILSIFLGLSEPGVDNAAHIGGLICGFVLEALLGSFKRGSAKSEASL
jgi:rhomboid protease GluP